MKAFVESAKGIIILDHNERIDNVDTVSDLLAEYTIVPTLISSNPIVVYGDLDYVFMSIMLKDTVTSSGSRIVRYEWTIYHRVS